MYRGADKSLAQPDWKKNRKVAIFHPTRRSLLLRRPGWTENFLIFFLVTCKSQSLVAVACFLPGRAKDISAPGIIRVLRFLVSVDIHIMEFWHVTPCSLTKDTDGPFGWYMLPPSNMVVMYISLENWVLFSRMQDLIFQKIATVFFNIKLMCNTKPPSYEISSSKFCHNFLYEQNCYFDLDVYMTAHPFSKTM